MTGRQHRLELADEADDAFVAAFTGMQTKIWTCLPALVVAFNVNAGETTVDCQATIQMQLTDINGNQSWVNLPTLIHCPVVFPSGGGFTLTFPLVVGDEVLIVFANRCIDAWHEHGGVQPQMELRLHDINDGFALPGPKSKPRVIPSISTDSVQLRKDDGTSFIEIQSDGDIQIVSDKALIITTATDTTLNVDGNLSAMVTGTAAVTSTGDMTLTAPNIHLNGNLTNNGVNIGSTHHHSSQYGDGGNHTGGPS